MFIFPINDWDDLASIVTLLSAPLILLSVYAGFRQIKAQTENSKRELSFNAIIALNEKFERSARDHRTVVERFNIGDKTVNIITARSVYNSYWHVIADEWMFFESGLLTAETLIGWCILAYAQISGETSVNYYDTEGQPQLMNSRERFEAIVLNGRYRHRKKFHAFYSGLYKLKAKSMQGEIITDDCRYEAISEYAEKFIKDNKINPLKI